MATTVTYKGATLATVENQTKTLQTAGTWVEDDFTLTDVTQGGGGISIDDIATNAEPSGNITLTVSSVGDHAFRNKMGILSLASDTVQTVGTASFLDCKGLVTVDLPNATNLGRESFAYCDNLTSVNVPNVTTLSGVNAFRETGLQTIRLPKVTALNQTFFNSRSLMYVHIPLVTQLNNNNFNNCPISVFDLPSVGSINSNAFNNVADLRTLILRKNAVVTLAGWNVGTLGGIYSNPTASTIYVPQALLSSYQTASNWSSAYSAGVTFTAIEGSIYETQYADGTVIS